MEGRQSHSTSSTTTPAAMETSLGPIPSRAQKRYKATATTSTASQKLRAEVSGRRSTAAAAASLSLSTKQPPQQEVYRSPSSSATPAQRTRIIRRSASQHDHSCALSSTGGHVHEGRGGERGAEPAFGFVQSRNSIKKEGEEKKRKKSNRLPLASNRSRSHASHPHLLFLLFFSFHTRTTTHTLAQF